MRLADRIMHRYLEEILRRQRGETTGVRALALALSGHVTACCGVTPSTTKHGEAKCPECHLAGEQCELRSWCAPRSLDRRARWGEIHVHETRSVNRGAEDSRLAREADRIVRLCRLVEVRPPACMETVWRRALAAWGLVLLNGAVEPGTPEEWARFETLRIHGFGVYSTWTHRAAIGFGREVVGKRAARAMRRREMLWAWAS